MHTGYVYIYVYIYGIYGDILEQGDPKFCQQNVLFIE